MTGKRSTGELVVLVTVPSREAGEELAERVVEERLAACVNIVGPIRSVYRWQGTVQRDDEHLLVIKTTRRRYVRLEARVRELHSYETPEVIALRITAGSAPYLEWVRNETGGKALKSRRRRVEKSKVKS